MGSHQGLALRVLGAVAVLGMAAGCSNAEPSSGTSVSPSTVINPGTTGTTTADTSTASTGSSPTTTVGTDSGATDTLGSSATQDSTATAGALGSTTATDTTAATSTGGSLSGSDATDTGTAGMADTTDTGTEEEVVVEEPVASLPTSLTFTVTTEPYGQSGRRTYTPRNIGAIWVETADGDFVKTLKMWAARRKQHLSAFNGATGGNTTDATTSATLSRHQTHTVEWDFTDSSGAEVEPGEFVIRVEGTEIDGAGPNVDVPFSTSDTGDMNVGDDGHFRDMSISFQ